LPAAVFGDVPGQLGPGQGRALAFEAGVPRNALTQRHTDLKTEFYQRIKERGAVNEDEARLRATIARLKKTIEAKNRDLAQLRADVPALVRAVSQLTLENQQLRDMHSAGGSIVPFPGRQRFGARFRALPSAMCPRARGQRPGDARTGTDGVRWRLRLHAPAALRSGS
jgi:hypothetical protein